jgi:hypothetical protein
VEADRNESEEKEGEDPKDSAAHPYNLVRSHRTEQVDGARF